MDYAKSGGSNPAAVILAIAAICFMGAMFAMANMGSMAAYIQANEPIKVMPPDIEVQPDSLGDVHADKHGNEADRARTCVKSGVDFVYKDRDGRFYLFCKPIDGNWALQIVKKVGRVWIEVTAYEPLATQDWNAIRDYYRIGLPGEIITKVKNLPW